MKECECSNKDRLTKGNFQVYGLITLIWLLVMNIVTAAVPKGRIKQFSINEGLSNNQVTALFQDSRGFIWVGTTDGLNRYDGYDFSVFRHHPLDSSSISGNYIQAITEDSNGNIWIGTRNSGIAIWNKDNGTFTNLDPENSDVFGKVKEKSIFGLLSIEDDVWVKTRNHIIQIKSDRSEFQDYGHYSSVNKALANTIYPIVSGDNCVWVGSKDGIHHFDLTTKSFKRFSQAIETSNKEITDLINEGDSILLVATKSGLWHYDYKNKHARPIPSNDKSVVSEPVYCLLQGQNRELYIGVRNGVMVSEYPYTSYRPLDLVQSNPQELKDITTLLMDRSGLLWVGTKCDGLIRIDQKPKKFSSIDKFSEKPFELRSYNFESVHVDDRGNIWLGTDNKGVYCIDPECKSYHQYRINPRYTKADDPTIRSILQDSSGKMWFGTTNGLYFLRQGNSYLEEFDYTGSTEFQTLLKLNQINDLKEDRLGNLWIATNFGLYRYNGRELTSYFADNESKTSLCSDQVNTLFEDSDGWLWIGTNKGINVYNPAEGFFLKLANNQSEIRISHNNVLVFTEEANKRIVIGTQSGVTFYDKPSRETHFLNEQSKLLDSKIYALEVDAFGRLWMSTGTGINVLSPNGSVFNYSKNDNQPDYNYNERASFKTSDSKIFFGGDKGLTIIKTDSIQQNLHQPQVVITGLQIFHKGQLEHSYHHHIDTIDIRYKRNSMIHIEFAAMEFTNPERNSFQVYIEGYDDDKGNESIPTTFDNYVNISNLSPGIYKLKVKGANSDFIWSNQPTELVMKVEPPLWMSNYAYAFYLISVIFLIQMLINYRIRNYRKAYRALQDKAQDKKKIEAQKEALSKINQSLTDSISYAKRIQEAMIPSEEMVRSMLPESFIYFRPKDIVSGDFYWVYKNRKKIFVAAVDCTGHGVPGAFMSIIGYDLLRNIVEIQKNENPVQIMNQLNHEVVSTFKKNGTEHSMNKQEVNDGMDMALVVIDLEAGILEFAGAYNPLYLIRDNEIITFKGNRFPIGYVDENNPVEFTKHEIPIQKNDIIYLFSDGYADQFGGPEGKKFKYRRFRHLLLNIHKLPIEDQKAILHQKMEEWMGTEYEQIDDILLMGLKL